jgi:small subunit ribosomal protein S2
MTEKIEEIRIGEGEKQALKEFKSDFGINIGEMQKAGVYLGHKISKVNPKMKPYISNSKNGVYLINLEKTAEKLEEALNFLKKSISEGKIVLLVGTKIQTKDLAMQAAIECNLPYISERWLGGTFTNFPTIRKRIDYFKATEKSKETGGLEKYTKKERMKIEKELKELETKFGGIKKMEKLPDIIFVLDTKKDSLALSEAKKKGIVTIAIMDTNSDPSSVDYFIPANDDSISSVQYILARLKEAVINK